MIYADSLYTSKSTYSTYKDIDNISATVTHGINNLVSSTHGINNLISITSVKFLAKLGG